MIQNWNAQQYNVQDQKASARAFKNKIRKAKQARDLSQKIEQTRHQDKTDPMKKEEDHQPYMQDKSRSQNTSPGKKDKLNKIGGQNASIQIDSIQPHPVGATSTNWTAVND